MEIDKITRIYRGRTYRVGDVIYPDCGHNPPDYIIEGFKQGKKYTHMWGYHPASDKKERFIRGAWKNNEVQKAQAAINVIKDNNK